MICIVCGKELEGGQVNFCSVQCENLSKEMILRLKDPKRVKKCAMCGKTFYAEHMNKQYCSDDCWNKKLHEKYIKNRTIYHKTCIVCGKEFDTARRMQKYCSDPCRNKAEPKKDNPEHFCVICGKSLAGKRGNLKYCSYRCQQEAYKKYYTRVKPKVKKCVLCGKEFIAKTNKQIYCSSDCREKESAKHRKKPQRRVYEPKKCIECGKTFVPTAYNQVCCSRACQDDRNRKRNKLHNKKHEAKERILREERRKNEVHEPTCEKDCPKNCYYRCDRLNFATCDYILITGEPRPCGIGKECTVYVRNKNHKERNRPTIVTKDHREDEITSYLIEKMNHSVGVEYRRGNVVSKNGTRRKG